jgi:DNA-binding LacI/PurR family transcriptional regulator
LAAPPLTTVAGNINATAQEVVDTVLARLDGRTPAQRRPRSDADRVVTRATV